MTNKEFLQKNETLILRVLIDYIPDVVRDETDDKTQLLRRILISGLSNLNLNDQFNGDTRKFAQELLINCGQVDLRKPFYKETPIFNEMGDIVNIKVLMPQISVFWEQENNTLICKMYFPDSDNIEQVETYGL